MNGNRSERSSGLLFAFSAYIIWGLLPLYLREVNSLPPFEFVGWRVLFTLPVCLLLVLLSRQTGQLRQALGNRRVLALLCVSTMLIGSNWLVYVVAVQQGHVLATSLGYYINPLINVLAGTVFLRERLSAMQWLAVAIAAAGAGALVWGAVDQLMIALALALTFSGYGLVRKLTPVEAIPGLTIETALMLLPALGAVLWRAHQPGGLAFGNDHGVAVLVALAGAITATPLLLFAAAARRLPFSVLGFCQYIGPSIVFVLGLTVFQEPLRPVQAASFALIWLAIGLFSWDALARRSLPLQG